MMEQLLFSMIVWMKFEINNDIFSFLLTQTNLT